MHYCLSREELGQLIELGANEVALDDGNLRLWIESARSWRNRLGVLAYFFSHILEKKYKAERIARG